MKHKFKKLFNEKKISVFSVIFVILLILVPALLQYYVHAALPETLVGEEGLHQLHTYLLRFNIASIIRIVLYIPAFVACVIFTVKSIKQHERILNIVVMILILFTIVTFTEPKRSYVDVQGKQFSDFPIIHAFQLYSTVEKDIDSEPVQLYSNTSLQVKVNDYSYYIRSRRHGSKRHRITEYSLETENNILISQISASDYNQFTPYVGEYAKHKVMCYPNSKLLYSLDDGEASQTNDEAEAEYYANKYTITYEEDGYLRWTPTGKKLSLVVLVDGKQQIAWNADGEFEYKPLFHKGHENVAYLEQWINGKGYTRVSNVISVTEPYIALSTKSSTD